MSVWGEFGDENFRQKDDVRPQEEDGKDVKYDVKATNAAASRDGELVSAGKRFAQWNTRRIRWERWRAKDCGGRRQRRGSGHFQRRKMAWRMMGKWKQIRVSVAGLIVVRETIRLFDSVASGYDTCDEGTDDRWDSQMTEAMASWRLITALSCHGGQSSSVRAPLVNT